MTTQVVPDDAIAKVARKTHELMRRVLEGTLDPEVVAKGLQELIERKRADHPLHHAARYFGIEPTVELAAALGPVPYSKRLLRECAKTHVLVPYLGLSLEQLHAAPGASELFYSKDWGSSWYGSPDQLFARATHQPRWYLVQKTVLEGSLEKSWQQQLELVESSENEVIPAAVLVFTVLYHYFQTGERLFPDLWARTSDLTAGGSLVYVGSFVADGLDVRCCHWDDPHSRLGVAVSRKL